ncbi:MAG: hypothetical protein O2971_01815 [Proteobacteria bacterium]|nr:hypothetical protein [Pseudomonadota bacterium]
MRHLLLVIVLLSFAPASVAQSMTDLLVQDQQVLGEGWSGFTDVRFLLNALLTLTLATVLGAIIAYHPKHVQRADTLEEIEAPKVFITYAMIGAIIGIMVVKYGLVVGFVLFGIGGLIRFRTILRSATLTGHVIFVTLIGLSCGLDLPHVAVLSTAFGFVLIFILDAKTTYRMYVRALPLERVPEAAASYRALLEAHGCRVMSEKKDPERQRFTLIFRSAEHTAVSELQALVDKNIDPQLFGTIDWEID